MLRATSVTPTGAGAIDTVTLGQDDRHRRRFRLRSDNGVDFLLDLAQARQLRHGEGLMLDDGRVIEVRAEAEDLMEVRGDDPRHLTVLAWQIGNRHLSAQIEADRILITPDEVVAQMLDGLGARVRRVTEPFDPEGGAYGDAAGGHHHGHDHTHDHD